MSVRRPTVVGMSSERLQLSPPPGLRPREGGGSALLMALPALGGVASVALVASMGMGAGGAMRTRSLLAAGVVLATTIGFVLVQLDRQRRQQQTQRGASRSDYLAYLAEVRETVRAAAARQRRDLLAEFPDPSALPGAPRPTETGDEPLLVRTGLTTLPLQLDLVAPERTPGEPPDPVAAAALHRLLEVHRRQRDLPATLDLRQHRRVVIGGSDPRSHARALLCSAAARHDATRMRIAVVASPHRIDQWEWVKWLPHVESTVERDRIGPRRLIASTADDLALSADDPAHLLMVIDGATVDEAARAGFDRRDTCTVIELDEGSPDPSDTVPDDCTVQLAEVIARRLADRRSRSRTEEVTLSGLLHADAATRERLRVPIGVRDDGTPVHLDLRESAEGGTGPHGLVVGATGSGKSELLRTLTTGLALTHPPEALNFVLVDFKGGATFAGLGGLPHTSALITNLSDDLALVDRMHDALAGELVRRQELLRSAGDFASLRDLDAARAAGAEVPALPALLVVIDEFSELLVARPEMAELFAAIGRLGRSLGVHLLLATQRLDEGRLRGLESHLGFRIALRTFSAAESRAAIDVTDAHQLPRTPGVGYLRTGPDALVRFRAVHVSSPVVRRDAPLWRVLPFTAAPVADAGPAAVSNTTGPTFLESAVAAVAKQAGDHRHAHRIWLPPLQGTVALPALLPDLAPDPRLGLVSPAWRTAGLRTFPVGVTDRPREQRHEPLVVQLDGATGHAAVIGAPRSGTSTLLRTLITGLALTSTPEEAHVALIDLGSGDLMGLADLPHVIAAADRTRPERIRAIVRHTAARVDRGREGAADLFIVIDGWGSLRDLLPDPEAELIAIAQRSLSSGVHLLISANRWADVRPALRDAIGTRLELRLGDPAESEHDRQLARLVPIVPGRGLTPSGHHFLAADPGPPAATAASIRSAWRGADAPRLPELPPRIDLNQLLTAHRTIADSALLLGVREDLSPLGLAPADLPHLLVHGDSGSGKSSLLRTLAHELARTHSADEVRLLVVDPRRSLAGDLPESHLLDHVATPDAIVAAMADLADVLRNRLPGPEISPAQLRARGWWSGPEVWLLVDDHDLTATGGTSPFVPLHDLLPHAADIGLHVAITRQASGASRSHHDPLIQAHRANGAPALLLDGPPDEGPLAGPHRAAPQPPGRGLFVTRREAALVQVAWLERQA
jgi:S-DNA-T family DNA segregation ATPase FtsK/SpoIIIE